MKTKTRNLLLTVSALITLYGVPENSPSPENFLSVVNRSPAKNILRSPAVSLQQAQQTDLASHSIGNQVVYKISDGYGEYTGRGATKIEASSQAREACVLQKVTSYEHRFGATPDADTADLFIDACINR